MKVLYLTQVFETERDPGSDRHFFFCKYLVERGHSATAVTSNVDYKRACVKYPGTGWRLQKQVEGVDIRYVYSYPNFRGSFAKRLLFFVTYLLVTVVEGARVKGVDVVYASSVPLTVGLLGFVLSRIHRVPLFFEVTDVWPDAAVAVGVVKNRAIIRAASWLERFCYRKARRIVALTEGIRDNIVGKGIPGKKVMLVTNGVDASLFRSFPAVDRGAMRLAEDPGFNGQLVCMYMGAHGTYNALGTIIDAADELRDDPRFLFVLVGDGDEKSRLEALAHERRLANIRFFPPIERSSALGLLRSASIFLLPNRRGQFFSMNLPNKLFDFLASGRPVIVAGEGESANLVMRARAGLVVGAEDGKAMARALTEMASLSEAGRAAMGHSGREFVLKHYDRKKLYEPLAEAMEQEIR